METKKIDSSKVLSWYAEGWRLFAKDPGLWVLLTFAFLAINIALTLVPLVGQVALALLTPALYGGLLHGVRESFQGRKLHLKHLFSALMDPEQRRPMLMLGVLALGAQAAMLGIAMVLGFSQFLVITPGEAPVLNPGGGAMLGLLVVLIFAALMSMALLYAVPLVFFARLDPVAAVKSSFGACWRNIGPLTIAGLIYLGLAALASLAFFLGFLILIPVTLGAVYASYRAIFEGSPPSDFIVIE
ncbi:MAG: BPSS1780 family membrane protein [Gammaproteobacteria bacterium]